MCVQPTGLLELTVTVRRIPLVTAACGTRGGTAGKNDALTWRRRLPSGPKARPVLGNHRLVGTSLRARGARAGRLELWPASWSGDWWWLR
jgi:hypothetical protein